MTSPATTGVQAVATNTATFSLTAGTAGDFSFALQASSVSSGGTATTLGSKISVDATSISEAVSQINQQTSTTGIVASSASGKLSLTQTAGQNIKFDSIAVRLAQGHDGHGGGGEQHSAGSGAAGNPAPTSRLPGPAASA